MRTASDIIAEIAYDAYWDSITDLKQEGLQMKKSVLTNAKLMSYERGNLSIYGNPSYHASFSNGSEEITGKTASNAQCGYTLKNFRDGRACSVTYHITRAGNTIIDKIKEA